MIRIQGTLRLLLKISFLFSCVQSLILLQSHVSTNKAAPINPKIMDQNISREPQSKHSPLRSLNIIGRKSFILSTSSFFWSATLFPSLVLSETDGDQPAAPSTKYYTGKQPVVPGGKPREKGDVKGTKKDPQFLLSISQCKSQCETRSSPNAELKSKEDCLSECQDICCTTYEQCTFSIVPR